MTGSQWKRLSLGFVIVMIVLGPWLVGALYGAGWAAVLGLLALYALVGFSGHPRFVRWRGPALTMVSIPLTITVVDLALRPILGAVVYARPYTQYLGAWPPMPLVRRYAPDYHWSGSIYGDLARAWEARNYREYRQIDFLTDANGFRNTLPGSHKPELPLDLIILGDSFGEGEGSSQQDTWAALLGSKYHLQVYNLSIKANSPWEEYATLAMTHRSLPTRPGAVVVWALYNGNDLDDSYQPFWDPARFPFRGPLGQVMVSWGNFQDRSPLHQAYGRVVRLRLSFKHPARKDAVDGNPAREFPSGKKVLFFQEEMDRVNRNYQEVRQHPHYRPLCATVRAMKRLTRERGLTLAIMLIPIKSEVYSWLLQGDKPWTSSRSPGSFSLALSQLCTQEGIPYFDAKSYLIDASQQAYQQNGELLWWRDDSHIGIRGHKALASYVHDKLLASLTRRTDH